MGMETSAGTFVLGTLTIFSLIQADLIYTVGSKVPGNAAFVDNMLSAGMISPSLPSLW